MHKKILLITYHFPPSAASGSFRLLGFARHLPAFGWQPLVVAPPTLPWEPIDPELVADVPANAVVRTTPYPTAAPRLLRMLAQNAIWLPRAWSACMQMIAEHRPDVVLTSGPPHCVHALGHYLKRRTGLPWVADFRDPWISDGGAAKLDWWKRWALGWERRVFAKADLILANAPNACRLYQATYPDAAARIVTLTNGFDPAPMAATTGAVDALELLHAGEIYAGRNPAPLLEALASLRKDGSNCTLKLLGRCDSGEVPALLRERGWTDFVILERQRDYAGTLDAMRRAAILVLFDSPGRTIGVPAKLYEYLGAGRPILALAESDGDTAAVLRDSGVVHCVAAPTNVNEIRTALRALLDVVAMQTPVVQAARLDRFTRANLAGQLARRLDGLIGASTVTAARVRVEQHAQSEVLEEALS